MIPSHVISSTLIVFLSTVIIIPVASTSSVSLYVEPSEFLRSFLTRSHMLDNVSNTEDKASEDENSKFLSMSLNIDNWSAYDLQYNAHTLTQGDIQKPDKSPRSIPAKRRGLALRAFAKKGNRVIEKTSGMAAWTLDLTDGPSELSYKGKPQKVTVAWDLGGSRPRFAISIGKFVPQYDDMWKKTRNAQIVTETSWKDPLEKVIAIADSKITVGAELRKDKSKRFTLIVTIIPQNVDIFGWVKYFKGESAATTHKRNSDGNRDQEHNHALPKVSPKESAVDDTQKKADMVSDWSKQGIMAKKGSEGEEDSIEEGSLPLFHRKELLNPGKSVLKLEELGRQDIREALHRDAADRSVAVGIQIENWSRFLLVDPAVEIRSGKPLKFLQPPAVYPGKQEVTIISSSSGLRGTEGALHWMVGSETGKTLSLMWSVPYNMQFYNTWVAVGLTPSGEKVPTFKEMYSERNEEQFVRVKAGHEFEFSDGKFIVMAYMDGGAKYKPVLHIGLVPIEEADLASSVLKQLGMKVSRPDDDGIPRVGLVQNPAVTNNISAQMLNSGHSQKIHDHTFFLVTGLLSAKCIVINFF